MRRFVVTNPNLSVGRPGSIVDEKQLHMTDEKLDEWVAAGYAVELHDAEPVEQAPLTDDDRQLAQGLLEQLQDVHTDTELDAINTEILNDELDDEDSYHPSAHSVTEVLKYLDENPGHVEFVLALERAGKARSGILSAYPE